MKIYGSFNADSVIKKPARDYNGNIVKYDNHGEGKQCCSPRSWDEVRDSLLRTLSTN